MPSEDLVECFPGAKVTGQFGNAAKMHPQSNEESKQKTSMQAQEPKISVKDIIHHCNKPQVDYSHLWD